MHHTPVFVSIDTPDVAQAAQLCAAIVPSGAGIKLGLEFFNAQGPSGIVHLRDKHPDTPLFIDLKYHDIPNTVAGALRSIAALAPEYLNVHAAGGMAMMQAGMDALADEAQKRSIKTPKLLAVTVLTSLSESDLSRVGQAVPVMDQVVRLAKITQQSGLAGVVCSPLEITAVRAACGADFILMVPGIRPVAQQDDQKRTMTPAQALKAGATHLVIGRPITAAPDPGQACADILATLP